MPNKNYIAGVKKERAIVNENRNKGLLSFRSAGSHSDIDVVVVDIANRKISFYQCKPSNFSDTNKNKILNTEYNDHKLSELNGEFNISFEIV